MMPTRGSQTVTPVTMLSQWYAVADRFQKGLIFMLGAVLLLGSLYLTYLDAVRDHHHTVIEMVERLALLIAALMMIVPGPTLKLLAIIPLPDFMHREERRRRPRESPPGVDAGDAP